MSKLRDPKLYTQYDVKNLTDILRPLVNTVNQLAEGRLVSYYLAQSAVPTSGLYGVGDFIPNANPVEQSSVAPGISAKYILRGWECTTAGTAGGSAVFKECRALTGN